MRAFPIMPTIMMFFICILLIISIMKNNKRKTYIVIVILLFFLNQRFMIKTDQSTTISNNVDVLFVIDNTISMNAEDYQSQGKRLDGVKKDCEKIINELNGARFGIITFNNKAKVLIPFTRDSNMALETIEIIEPIEELYARGSSLNVPLEDTLRVLNNSYKSDPERIRVLFFISDGEITDNSSLKSFTPLNKYIKDGAVLGYGTNEGGIMHYYDSLDKQTQKVIMDTTSYPQKEAISKIDEKNLKQIASNLKVDYIHMENSNLINKKIQDIKNVMTEDMGSSALSSYKDIYYIFAIPLLILIVIEFKRVWRDCI